MPRAIAEPKQYGGPDRHRWGWLALFGVLIVFSLAAACYRLFWKPTVNLDKGSSYRGIPYQRRKIEGIIAGVGAESIETMITRLNDEAGYNYPNVHSPAKGAQLDLLRCLSNRRTIRLWELLDGLAEAERNEVLERLAKRTFEEQRATVERVLQSKIDPNAPKNSQSLVANKLAICAYWWLVVQFQGLEDLLDHIEQIETYRTEIETRVVNDPRLPDDRFLLGFGRNIAPDNACKLNILVLALEHDDRATSRVLKTVRQRLTELPTKQVLLTGWDAHTTAFDIPHVYEGVPIDRTKGITEFEIYDWGHHVFDKEFQRRTVEEVKRIAVALCSGKSS